MFSSDPVVILLTSYVHILIFLCVFILLIGNGDDKHFLNCLYVNLRMFFEKTGIMPRIKTDFCCRY